MPDNPNNWTTMFSQLPPMLTGVLMAMILAPLRLIYDNKETKVTRIVLESLICGALTLTVGGAVIALELNMYWALFAGGVIGNMGSTTVRNLALRLIKREIGDK